MGLLLRLFLDERERWFYWLPVALIGGISLYFALPAEPSVWWFAASPVFALLLFLARRNGVWKAALSLPFFFLLGFNAAQLQTRMSAVPMLNESVEVGWFKGMLMKAEPLPEGTRLLLKYTRIHDIPADRSPLFLRVKVKQGLAELPSPGSNVSFWGPVWPFAEPSSPGGYDFRRRFFFDRLGGTAISYGEIRVSEEAKPPRFFWDGFYLLFEQARRFLALRVGQILEGPSGAMTAALLSGQQTGIDQEVMQAMRVSGLSHLLSISGVHVSMMGLLVYVPLRAILALFPWIALRYPIKKWAALGAIIAAFLYTILVGPETPTVRSALMTAIVLLAVIADRRAMSLRLVALSAIVLMLIVPSDVMGPSFEMSFAAVLAMVVAFEKRLDHPEKEKEYFVEKGPLRWFGRHVRDIVLTSLVATAATAPFTIYHFQTFSFYGVFANMIAIPLTSFWIMPCILLTYLTAPFGLDKIFIVGTGWGVDVLISVARHVASWPYALFAFRAMPGLVLLAIVLGGFWLGLWRRRWRYVGLLPIVIGFLYPLYTTVPDVFIAEGGKDWAVRLSDGRLVTSGSPDKFGAKAWRQQSGDPETAPSKEFKVEDKKASPFSVEPSAEFLCGKGGCLFTHEGQKVAFLRSEAAASEACAKAQVVVASFVLQDCGAAHGYDAKAFEEKGSHALRFTKDGIETTTVRTHRGARPWSEGWAGF